MKRTRSNLNDKTTIAISSNTVRWEGENIECINLCTGDSVSEVVYQLGVEICTLKDTLNLSDLDLKCLVAACSECPAPDKTLGHVLQLLIDKICVIEDLLPSGGSTTPDELTTAIASCFIVNDSNGDPVTQLPVSEYVRRIGNAICTMQTTIGGHTTSLSNHETRIHNLENQAPPTLTIPTVVPSCTFETTAARTVDVVLAQVEKQFCELKAATGAPTAISTAVAKQCQGLKDMPAFSSVTAMSGITGWVADPRTMSDAMTNMWLTICDMRAALKNIADCCAPNCSNVIVDFDVIPNEGRDQLNLMFNGLCSVPAGYSNCNPAGSRLTITDSAGHRHIVFVDVMANLTDIEGETIDLSGTAINTNLTYTVKLEVCLTKDGVQCNKEIIKTDLPPCGMVTTITASLV